MDNLCKDMFLRKHMDSQGYVFLKVIADFNRIKSLTQDMELIRYVCYQSRTIEYRVGADGKDRLRRRDGWDRWTLAVAERDPSAQNDGPTELYVPPVPQVQGFDPRYLVYPATAASPGADATDHLEAYRPLSEVATSPGVAASNGSSGQHRYQNMPTAVRAGALNGSFFASQGSGGLPNGGDPEADSFTDDRIEALSVIVRRSDITSSRPAPPAAASRTFSNGSIDSRSAIDEVCTSADDQVEAQANGHPSTQE